MKRWLLPLIALAIGLCVPIYSYAASEAECTACHNWCSSNASSAYQYCYASMIANQYCTYYPYPWGCSYDYAAYNQCINEVSAVHQACHDWCGQPGNGCVD